MNALLRCLNRPAVPAILVAVSLLSAAAPAKAQFGTEYLRYSRYGSGPYGYGSPGYHKAATPELPGYRDIRLREPDYGYEPKPTYEGTLPLRRTVEIYTREPRRVPVHVRLARPEYDAYGRVYAPYPRFVYGFGEPTSVYRSIGLAP